MRGDPSQMRVHRRICQIIGISAIASLILLGWGAFPYLLGCPPVCLMGWLNKLSLFNIELDADRCVRCGICGQVCLTRSPKQGAGWDEGINPADSYSCIRCGSCIDACPERALFALAEMAI